MPDLNFEVTGAEAVSYAASPLLALKLHITTTSDVQFHSVLLRCQIMIETTRRHYTPEDQARLLDLFGEPDRWGQTLRSMLWTHVNLVVPAFQNNVAIDLPVPCSFDFNVAGTKYFYALQDGEIPLSLLFSGSIFYATSEAPFQVSQISWEKEAKYRLPVQVWKDMMEHYYPNTAWLCLRKDMFDRLYEFKMQNGIPTWEQTLERILPDEKDKLLG